MSPLKIMLIDAIKGRGVPYYDAQELVRNGFAVFTGNQYHERWEWVDAKLQEQPLQALDELYGYLVIGGGQSAVLKPV